MTRSHIHWMCSLALMVASSSIPLAAQNETGSITGHVTDSSGAVVTGATITVTDLGTNVARTAKSGSSGEYTFSSLRPSHYKIVVSANGFQDSEISDLELHTQATLAENIRLAVGSSSQTVTVNAETSQIDTSSAVTTTIDRHFVENMPLSGRSFQALITLTPGNVTAKTYYTNAGQFSIDGQRTDEVHDLATEVLFAVLGDVYLLLDRPHQALIGLLVLPGVAVLHLLAQRERLQVVDVVGGELLHRVLVGADGALDLVLHDVLVLALHEADDLGEALPLLVVRDERVVP